MPDDLVPRTALEQQRDLTRVQRLADAMRREGGDPMQLLQRHRSLGGHRVRMWLPTPGAAQRVQALARSFGWRNSRVMEDHNGDGGYQLTVDMPTEAVALHDRLTRQIAAEAQARRALPG